MKVEYIINNYQAGAKLKTAPQDKILKQERTDSRHLMIIFDINAREKEFLDLLFAKKGKII